MEFGKLKIALAAGGWVVVFALVYGTTFMLGSAQPIWALGLATVSVAIAWVLLHSLARRAAMMPFKAKGRVLRGAKVRLDQAETLPAPDWMADLPEGAEEDDDLEPLYYYRLVITVAPAAPKGVFQLWDPHDLTCVAEGFKATWKAMSGDEEPGFELENLEIWDGTAFAGQAVGKVPGRRQLRFSVGVSAGTRRLQMLYYFETFGKISLPPHPLMPPS